MNKYNSIIEKSKIINNLFDNDKGRTYLFRDSCICFEHENEQYYAQVTKDYDSVYHEVSFFDKQNKRVATTSILYGTSIALSPKGDIFSLEIAPCNHASTLRILDVTNLPEKVTVKTSILLDFYFANHFCFYKNDVICSGRRFLSQKIYNVFKVNLESKQVELLWKKDFKSRIMGSIVIEEEKFFFSLGCVDNMMKVFLIDKNGDEKDLNYAFLGDERDFHDPSFTTGTLDVFFQQEEGLFFTRVSNEGGRIVDIVGVDGEGIISTINLSSILDAEYFFIEPIEKGSIACFYSGENDENLKVYILNTETQKIKQKFENVKDFLSTFSDSFAIKDLNERIDFLKRKEMLSGDSDSLEIKIHGKKPSINIKKSLFK